MLRLLLQHLRYFRRLTEYAMEEHKRYEKFVKGFGTAAALFKRQSVRAGSALNADLLRYERQMRRERWVRQQHYEQFWQLHLLPYDRSAWTRPKWMLEKSEWAQDFPAPPRIIELAEKVFQRVRYPSDFTKIDNLHTWFQLRAAVVFRLFLCRRSGEPVKELTPLTTARLIVLLYHCAALGTPYGVGTKFLKLKYTTRRMTVNGVYEKLRRYGVDKVPFASEAIPEVLIGNRVPPREDVRVLYCRNFDELVQAVAGGGSVVAQICVDVASDTVIERFSDGRVTVEFSPEYTEHRKDMIAKGYTLIGVRDGTGVLLNDFKNKQERHAAQLAVNYASESGALQIGRPGSSEGRSE